MSDEMVTVATFRYLPEAEACKIGLEAEGLTVFLSDAETVRANWFLTDAKVQVPSSQVDRADEVLTRIRQRKAYQLLHADQEFCLACGQEMAHETSTCPACGWSFDHETQPALSDASQIT